ncbi:unnamed protein product, partial [Porites evermanni]
LSNLQIKATESKTGLDNVSSASLTETTLKEGRCLLDMEDVKIVEKQLGNLVMDIGNENDPSGNHRKDFRARKYATFAGHCTPGVRIGFYSVYQQRRTSSSSLAIVSTFSAFSLGKDNCVIVLIFDMSAAFDTVENHIVLQDSVAVLESKERHWLVLCSTVVVTLHFLETALFTWMFVEGINLYNKLVKVFSMRKQYLAFAAIGWGALLFLILLFQSFSVYLETSGRIPAVIVGITAAINPSTYDMKAPLKEVICGPFNFTGRPERERCWLNGSTWIYKGPVLFFLLVNIGMFLILLRVIFGKLSNKYNKENVKFARKGLRSMLALLPLLGVTYILGYFLQVHIAVQYLFVLLNSTQGVTFTIFHCVFDDQITEGLKKLCGKNTVPQKPKKNPK